jgi:hypothetical protein
MILEEDYRVAGEYTRPIPIRSVLTRTASTARADSPGPTTSFIWERASLRITPEEPTRNHKESNNPTVPDFAARSV